MFGAFQFGEAFFADSNDGPTPPPPITRGDCGGAWGTATFGQPYYGGHSQCDSPVITRGDCGGIFGTATFGQPYYGGHNQCDSPAPPSRTNCGGIWGTATFGQPYYGGHYQCGSLPPPPPTPPDDSPGGGSGKDRRWENKRIEDERRGRFIERDDEEIATLVGIWLNFK